METRKREVNGNTPASSISVNGIFNVTIAMDTKVDIKPVVTPVPNIEDEEESVNFKNSTLPIRLGFIPGRRVPRPRQIQNDDPKTFLAGNTRAPNDIRLFPGNRRNIRPPGNRHVHSGPWKRGSDHADHPDDESKQTDSTHYSKRLECHQIDQDFKSRGERQCCLKSAKCFQNFPDDLDEFAKHNHQPGEQVDSVAACGHIDDALLCMSRVFRREECRATAVVVNKNLKEELTIVKKIYKNHCHGTTTPNPIPKTTSNSPGGQGLMTSAQGGSLPMGALIAAGVGGLLVLLLIILIVVLVKRRKRPMDGRSDEKVMFENSSNASSRYKSFTRKNSDVYAEIDERALANMQQENNNSSTISNSMTSLDGRPLPSAPGKEDKTGYLTPRSMSKEIITEVPGYDELAHSQSETGSPSYDKLELNKSEEVQDYEEQVPRHDDGDCEYITPTSDNAPQVQTKPDDTYHTYFVLEK